MADRRETGLDRKSLSGIPFRRFVPLLLPVEPGPSMAIPPQSTFSVIIPTFNYGAYLGRAIESVLNQTGEHNAEVVVIDDGSTDDTPRVAADYADRIRYIRQANQGVSAARNRGLDEAVGEWIVFLDADDRLVPTALTRFAESISNVPEARLHFGHYYSVASDGTLREAVRRPFMRRTLDNFERFLRRKFTISRGAACYHRDVFEAIRFPVGIGLGEDIVVDGQVLALFPAASIPHPLAEIYDHPGRSRDNREQRKRCGTRVVDALFDPAVLPAEALKLKPLFLARWYLTLARASYLAGDFRDARRFYAQAAAHRWSSLLHPTHGMRFLRSLLRAA
jgi:glycosyltransferase involved in cell wall biosynthesis